MLFKKGQLVKAKYLATSAGVRCPGDWYDGKITKVHADGAYDITYADGDRENAVLEKFIKASAEESRAADVSRATTSSQIGKKRRAQADPNEELAAATDSAATDAAATVRAAAASRRAGKRRAAPEAPPEAPPAPDPEAMAISVEDEDDEVAILEDGDGASGGGRAIVPVAPTEDEEDGDVQVTGRSGELALVDFPHSREFCATKPFVLGREAERCANCWCFVCDDQAASCPEWDCDGTHCKAVHHDPKWQGLRAAWKAAGGKPPAVAAGAAASSSSQASTDGTDGTDESRYPSYVSRLSCDEFLAQIQQVYPREEADPEGFPTDISLRPYQRQSLAFMVDVENSNDPTLLGRRKGLAKVKGHRYGRESWYTLPTNAHDARGGWLCDEVGCAACYEIRIWWPKDETWAVSPCSTPHV